MTDEQSEAADPSPGTVRIGAVRIRGFRGLVDTSLALQPSTTVLIGANNSGKTSVIEALASALRGRQATEDDLHVSVEAGRMDRFTVDMSLLPASGEGFADEARTVLGQAIVRGRSNAELVVLRATGQPSADGSGIKVDHEFLPSWPEPGEDDPTPMAQPRVNSRALNLLDFTLLDAQRDLVEQLRQRRSTWGRLLSRLDIPSDAATSIEDDLRRLGEQIIAASPMLDRLRSELGGISEALGASVSNVSLAPLPPRLEELARGIDVLVSTPHAASIPLRLQGMGSRSLAALMVFRAFTALRLGADLPIAPTPLTALEEPEAHLHPQAHGAVTTLIDAMPGQKVVSTHSPRVARVAALDDLRFVQRRGSNVEVRDAGSALTNQEQTQVRHLVLRPYGDVLFARLVVIGDGATEADAFPVFMRARWGSDPDGMGIAVVEVPSLGDAQVLALAAFLERIGIPWLALVDGDDAGRRAVEQIGDRLQRDLSQASELVWLPNGHSFERHLLAEGHATPVREGIEAFYGTQTLQDYAVRSRFSTEDDLLFHFLRKHKSSYGSAVAEAIVARQDEQGRPTLPTGVRQLLERAEEVLRW